MIFSYICIYIIMQEANKKYIFSKKHHNKNEQIIYNDGIYTFRKNSPEPISIYGESKLRLNKRRY